MRTYLVDGTNAVRRGAWDPRFPEMEEARTEGFLHDLEARSAGARVEIEVFFDGPRRQFRVRPGAPVRVRFTLDGDADAAILGSARRLLDAGRGGRPQGLGGGTSGVHPRVVVVTEDRGLADAVEAEGGKAIRFGEFWRRLREGKA